MEELSHPAALQQTQMLQEGGILVPWCEMPGAGSCQSCPVLSPTPSIPNRRRPPGTTASPIGLPPSQVLDGPGSVQPSQPMCEVEMQEHQAALFGSDGARVQPLPHPRPPLLTSLQPRSPPSLALTGFAPTPLRTPQNIVRTLASLKPLLAALWCFGFWLDRCPERHRPQSSGCCSSNLGYKASSFPRALLLTTLAETLIIHLLCGQNFLGVSSIKLHVRVN